MSTQAYLGFGGRNNAAISLSTNGRLDVDLNVVAEISPPSFTGTSSLPFTSMSISKDIQFEKINPQDLVPKSNPIHPDKTFAPTVDPSQLVPTSSPRTPKISQPILVDPSPLTPKIED